MPIKGRGRSSTQFPPTFCSKKEAAGLVHIGPSGKTDRGTMGRVSWPWGREEGRTTLKNSVRSLGKTTI